MLGWEVLGHCTPWLGGHADDAAEGEMHGQVCHHCFASLQLLKKTCLFEDVHLLVFTIHWPFFMHAKLEDQLFPFLNAHLLRCSVNMPSETLHLGKRQRHWSPWQESFGKWLGRVLWFESGNGERQLFFLECIQTPLPHSEGAVV